ncbi:MAG: hydantoin racemase [Deltaproteobacteria bacterium]|nr:hydantoin racemase [Deltaproteobacteria bacterium]
MLWRRPVTTPEFNRPIQELLDSAKAPETEVTVRTLTRGPKHVEYHYYTALVLADTLRQIKKAEQEGYDGAIIACFYDPGLREAREITQRMVVAGPGESAMHIAANLGRSFSIIVGRKKWIPRMHENVVSYGFENRLASFKSVDLGVLEFRKDIPETERRLLAAAREAVEEDMAEVIILGCTMEFGFYRKLQDELKVPVIDAILAPFKYTEFLIELKKRMNWGHSQAYDYEPPPRQEIEDWNLVEDYGLGDVWD